MCVYNVVSLYGQRIHYAVMLDTVKSWFPAAKVFRYCLNGGRSAVPSACVYYAREEVTNGKVTTALNVVFTYENILLLKALLKHY